MRVFLTELVIAENIFASEKSEISLRSEREQPTGARADRTVAGKGFRRRVHGDFVTYSPAVTASLVNGGFVHGTALSSIDTAMVLYKRDMDRRIAEGSFRGILNPGAGEGMFTLTRYDPAPDLAALVDRHWAIRWDLRGRSPHAQETLPYPQVNLVFGTQRPGLHGVGTKRFVAALEGEGWVIGTKFRAGGFRPFWRAPIRELTDHSLTVIEAFGDEGAAIDGAVHAAHDDAERIALIEDFLRACRLELDDDAALAARIVLLAQSEPSIARVSELALRAGVSVRRLQRVFSSHVGVSPSWVIRRFRVQEAADRVAQGNVADWPSLAGQLGYCDQAHFIREFKAQIGRTPGEYATLCATSKS